MRITVHIPDNIAQTLKLAAENEGLSISAMTAKALEVFLKQQRKQQAARRLHSLIGPHAVTPDALESLHRGRDDDRP
ncbi:MAG: hypothetical protein NTY51_12235 [Deltaproteobacteria bacterium]|nr:hypothetical protein [Deltaproteobacteria bacterium]